MSEVARDIVYLSKFGPTPKMPARVRIEMTIEQDPSDQKKGLWFVRAEVHLPDGSSRGIGKSVKADDKEHAEHKSMFDLVTLLGEMLADATAGMEQR